MSSKKLDMDNGFENGLNELKNKLIDISRRNKLINYKKPSKARNLKIIDESPEFIFDFLIKQEGKFKFDYIPEPSVKKEDLKAIDTEINEYKIELQKNPNSENAKQLKFLIDGLEEEKKELHKKALLTAEERAKELNIDISNELPDINLEDLEIDPKYTDDALQTLHYPEDLEKILTNIERNAKSIIEETGSNMLYLVLGVLKWTESNNSEQINNSPLINIPIVITKTKRNNRFEFTIEYSGEGLDTNISLSEKLLNDFGMVLPELSEETTFKTYLEEVYEVVKHKNWNLKQEISLDFLHFGKILMYQDLKEENWEDDLSNNPILKDIFIGKEIDSDTTFAPEYDIDSNEVANNIPLVMDADSSQHSAIVDVLEGSNVIIEGPPGTGKSQTISNIIASLMASGKSVLFVSEKLAALEVVYKRLDTVGLGDFCLELHSHKSQKSKILNSIQKRMDSYYSDIQILDRTIEEIEDKKNKLKDYIDIIHTKFGGIDESIYKIFWSTEKYSKGSKYLKFDIPNAKEFTHYRISNIVEQLEEFKSFHKEYPLVDFYWNGFDVYKLDFVDIDIFLDSLANLKNKYIKLDEELKSFPFQLEDEYNEINNIGNLSTDLNSLSIEAELLNDIDKNKPTYKEFLDTCNKAKKQLQNLNNSLNEIEKLNDLNNKLINLLSKIYNVIKSIIRETGLQKDTSMYFTEQLLSSITQLSIIDKQDYINLSSDFGLSSIEPIISDLKQDYQQYIDLKNNLTSKTNIETVDDINSEKISHIIKIIEDKKDSFFNFFSSEFKEAKNNFKSLLSEDLPSAKSEWIPLLKEIKEYIDFKSEYNNNTTYKNTFNSLFEGTQTYITNIENLHQWAKTARLQIKNNRLLEIVFSGNELIYDSLISYKSELSNLLSEFDSIKEEVSKSYDKKVIKKLFEDIDDIDILSSKDNIEEFADIIYSTTNDFKNRIDFEQLELKTMEEIQDKIDLIQNNNIDLYNLKTNIENLLNTLQDIKNYESVNINTSNEYLENIELALNILEIIEKSQADVQIKNSLINNYSILTTINNIKLINDDINTILSQIKKYGVLNKSFYGNDGIKIANCIDKLNEAQNNKNTLSVWADYRKISHSIIELGLKGIVENTESNKIPLDDIISVFKYNFYNTLIKNIFREYSLLSSFSRLSHEQIVKTFKDLDKQLINQNRNKVAHLSSQRDVPSGYRSNRKSELTELSLIENEVGKQKRHIPIRQLVKRAPNALKGLKPCFMMSPLSVSQYLPPNKIKFDVLVIDEASQLKPEEALGCIARVNQIVIVGDPKQLPPTSFFDSMDKSEEEETVASESESILDLCLNLYKPIRQLRWHYRSQHETLINFSNQQFYDGNLIVFPSPSAMNNDELGIKYHYIENSVFQNRINKVEAKVIIDHLEKQMTKYPDKSIGIGTFNSDQRDLIQGLLDEREKISPMVSNYISKWANTSEPFFIKNLENLQGDERDVIFISTTYGKDKETGKIYQRFGPINTDTGWRRLNVMFTRSKQKMEIFTSLNSSDIILSENSSRGVRALKSFLNYLETGVMKKAPEITDKGFDSEFEESVYEILDNYGYKVIPQVGVAGYFIDLSVVSEKNPNDFVLAIECDGATYHSSKSARDRDRLKQEVLEKLGWTVYRIWSVDWYKNRENEISKLIQAVKEAQSNYKGKVQEEPEYQEILVEEVKQIDKDIDKEIKKEKEEHTSDDKKITKNQYSQIFLSDEKVKEMLIELRDSKIATEFEIDRRCILSDIMIELFIKYKPINITEFRDKIPKRYRNENIINIEQMKYLNDIFDILELADE